jgi:hypothetical protein
MGMDLIGFIVVAPKELDRTQIRKALAGGKRRIKAAQKKHGMKGPHDVPTDPDQYDNDEDIDLLQLDARKSLDDLFTLWKEGARDTMARDYPSKSKYIILVAGEGSWGDEPGGFGYQTLKAAYLLGYNEAFNFR